MGVRVFVGDEAGCEGYGERKAFLFDSVTEKPLPLPLFESHDDAANFCTWFTEKHGDPRAAHPTVLDLAHTLWLKKRCGECFEWECTCYSIERERDGV